MLFLVLIKPVKHKLRFIFQASLKNHRSISKYKRTFKMLHFNICIQTTMMVGVNASIAIDFKGSFTAGFMPTGRQKSMQSSGYNNGGGIYIQILSANK